jgi:acyl carrier protein
MESTETLIETFRRIASEVTERPVPELSLETDLRSLGVDSISLAEIVARIEDTFAIDVPASTWLSVRTLRELLDVVADASGQTAKADPVA